MDTLKLIVCERLRVLMVSDPAIPQALVAEVDEDEEALQDANPSVVSLTSSIQLAASAVPCSRGLPANGAGDNAAHVRGGHGISEREEQILKALVRGYSNKMIARMHSVTEATVKVHMKSILRKVRVANRTQAAIWALKNGHFSEGIAEEGPRTPKAAQEMVSA
jgi:two-component system nitrate/nitrite response regulator NarL